MKAKLFGITLIILGLATLGWVVVIVLLTKGMAVLLYGVIPLIAGWLIFSNACKQSPIQNTEKADLKGEIKTGVGWLRSFLKGLL